MSLKELSQRDDPDFGFKDCFKDPADDDSDRAAEIRERLHALYDSDQVPHPLKGRLATLLMAPEEALLFEFRGNDIDDVLPSVDEVTEE